MYGHSTVWLDNENSILRVMVVMPISRDKNVVGLLRCLELGVGIPVRRYEGRGEVGVKWGHVTYVSSVLTYR